MPLSTDCFHPTNRQIEAVEYVLRILVGHPVKKGSALHLTMALLQELHNADELEALDRRQAAG